jgi:VanZ family protein
MAYGAADELTQHFVPGRSPDTMDFAADAAGLWFAIGIYVAAKYCRRVLRQSPVAA